MSTRTYMKGEDRREQILDAATMAFAEHGYQNTSIAVVCKQAEIARGTLYQYFEDKQSLFRELIEAHVETLRTLISPPELDDLLAQGAGPIVRDRMERILGEVQQNREVFMIINNEARAKNAETADLVRSMFEGHREQLQATIEFAGAAGVARVRDTKLTAEFILNAVFGVADLYLIEPEVGADVSRLADNVTELVLNVLRIEPNPS